MLQTFNLRKFMPDDLQSVMQINRETLPENYTDYFFMDLHERFAETFVVAEEDHTIVGLHHVPHRSGLVKLRLRRLNPEGTRGFNRGSPASQTERRSSSVD